MDSPKNNKTPVIELLEDIKDYMIEEDCDCGEQGSEILRRINNLLYDIQSGQPG